MLPISLLWSRQILFEKWGGKVERALVKNPFIWFPKQNKQSKKNLKGLYKCKDSS